MRLDIYVVQTVQSHINTTHLSFLAPAQARNEPARGSAAECAQHGQNLIG
jgi:hypothetical protein